MDELRGRSEGDVGGMRRGEGGTQTAVGKGEVREPEELVVPPVGAKGVTGGDVPLLLLLPVWKPSGADRTLQLPCLSAPCNTSAAAAAALLVQPDAAAGASLPASASAAAAAAAVVVALVVSCSTASAAAGWKVLLA
eukprot:94211-Pelagomonas_calceolata.AAC.4